MNDLMLTIGAAVLVILGIWLYFKIAKAIFKVVIILVILAILAFRFREHLPF